ncbi:hypothetical protein [Bacillus thuringiensis]|uniref:hypothetical protein n=1 Tax=Bacillus thuringiensis TaxID=1428 RepID=UPI00119FEF0F|nr:hypothetical protein [Bacillus thuringiensis]
MIDIIHTRREKVQQLLTQHRNYYTKQRLIKRMDKCKINIYDDLNDDFEGYKKYSNFMLYLMFRIEDIISGEPSLLDVIVTEIKTEFGDLPYSAPKNSKEKKSSLCDALQYIFDYDGFCKAKTWGAYSLVRGLQVMVCPYCNCQYTPTVETEAGRVRPTLDHFYDKGTYPFLALSFFNLIPSCYACNSSLKNTKSFSVRTHIHPYIEGFDDYMRFTVKFKEHENSKNQEVSVDYTQILNLNTEVFEIDFKPSEGKKGERFFENAERNIIDFKLREIYNLHKDYVAEILLKSEIYNDGFIKMIQDTFPNLFSSKEEILRMITSNYIEIDDLEKRTLAKLTRDIAHEFGLIKQI